MQIKHFSCSNLNAFLNYEFDVFSDVSFLHGINGSGKTSVLRAIASLLTPDPTWLFTSSFEKISVVLDHHGQEYAISATSIPPNNVMMQISGGIELSETFSIDELLPALNNRDEEAYWRANASAAQEEWALRSRRIIEGFKTFSFIGSLPTPIFLGLDRTTLSHLANPRASQRVRNRSVHSYFRTSLDDALYEAERLVTTQLASLSAERNLIFETLRNQFVLSLFQAPDDIGPKEPFNKPPISRIQKMRHSVTTAMKKIAISSREIEATVEPFFQKVFAAADLALKAPEAGPKNENISSYLSSVGPYLALRPSISIIERTVEKIEAANARESIISQPLETYTNIMNSFFGDSRKAIVFDQNNVRVRLPSGKTADITALSSGERQIFVLITHLLFNPSMRDENVLLIDEPELSLHLKWQRQFVPAIRKASPAIQMILATHSPEIIFDLEDKLIPLEL